jgi:hypothetical protein
MTEVFLDKNVPFTLVRTEEVPKGIGDNLSKTENYQEEGLAINYEFVESNESESNLVRAFDALFSEVMRSQTSG